MSAPGGPHPEDCGRPECRTMTASPDRWRTSTTVVTQAGPFRGWTSMGLPARAGRERLAAPVPGAPIAVGKTGRPPAGDRVRVRNCDRRRAGGRGAGLGEAGSERLLESGAQTMAHPSADVDLALLAQPVQPGPQPGVDPDPQRRRSHRGSRIPPVTTDGHAQPRDVSPGIPRPFPPRQGGLRAVFAAPGEIRPRGLNCDAYYLRNRDAGGPVSRQIPPCFPALTRLKPPQ